MNGLVFAITAGLVAGLLVALFLTLCPWLAHCSLRAAAKMGATFEGEETLLLALWGVELSQVQDRLGKFLLALGYCAVTLPNGLRRLFWPWFKTALSWLIFWLLIAVVVAAVIAAASSVVIIVVNTHSPVWTLPSVGVLIQTITSVTNGKFVMWQEVLQVRLRARIPLGPPRGR